jgi:hypothetical protein
MSGACVEDRVRILSDLTGSPVRTMVNAWQNCEREAKRPLRANFIAGQPLRRIDHQNVQEDTPMRSRLFHVFAILNLIAAMGLLTARTAQAQTVAAGPYYATPSWDQTLPCTALANCPRFIVLSNMNSDAVLDRETGLVWEKTLAVNRLSFNDADIACLIKVIGNRQGWRLPTVHELRTLMDPSAGDPALPDGHPFVNIPPPVPFPFSPIPFWTSTQSLDPSFPNGIYAVTFNAPNSVITSNPAGGGTARRWCVRGPGGTPR